MFKIVHGIKYTPPYEFGMRLMSDLHIGCVDNDYDLLQWEFDQARKCGDRIAINGDVFDAIFPSDRKRFRHTGVLHERLQGTENIIGALIDWATEIMGPYADLIDMIGVGNHDDSATKNQYVDLVLEVAKNLNKSLSAQGSSHRIQYGGYSGWMGYTFNRRRIGFVDSLRIQYHHGSGGSAPVTKGMIDFHRTDAWLENADVIWKGHKHNKLYYKDRVSSLTRDCSQHILRPRLHVLTGAYRDTYMEQTQDSVFTHGRFSNWGEDMHFAPQGKGGFRLVVKFDVDNIKKIRLEDEEWIIDNIHEFSELEQPA